MPEKKSIHNINKNLWSGHIEKWRGGRGKGNVNANVLIYHHKMSRDAT